MHKVYFVFGYIFLFSVLTLLYFFGVVPSWECFLYFPSEEQPFGLFIKKVCHLSASSLLLSFF